VHPLLPGPKIYFALFGGVRAWRTQQPLDVGPPQRQALLSLLLAADGRVTGVSDLIDTMWGDRPSPSALNLLHRYVGQLRRTFEPDLPTRAPGRWLLRSGNGYQLLVDAVSCDLRRFRLLNEHAAGPDVAPETEVDLRLQALTLAAGPPGETLPFRLAQAAPFQAIERERMHAARAAADAALRCDRPHEVVPHLIALTARHPLDEPLHARLIDCLAATGQRAEALDVFATVRRRLTEELGIAPGRALAAAHSRVVGDAVPARPPRTTVTLPLPGLLPQSAQLPPSTRLRRPAQLPPAAELPLPTGLPSQAQLPSSAQLARPAQLPPPPVAFVGRERELAAADAILDRPGNRICAVTGLPGIGKTDFALHWAHHVAAHFPDGQLYVDLGGADGTGADPRDVLRGFLSALGIPTPDPGDEAVLAAAFHRAVRGRRLLFVLDDARGSQQVRALLPADPHCLVIATSRFCLTGVIAHEGAQPIPLETPPTGGAAPDPSPSGAPPTLAPPSSPRVTARKDH
jgi:DNA-binding SARP family transcriptional activator